VISDLFELLNQSNSHIEDCLVSPKALADLISFVSEGIVNKNTAKAVLDEMFISGNLALMFGYAYHIPVIDTSAPKLNYSVVKFPQIEGNPPTNINFANYWVETVSKKSEHKNEAWNFVQFITSADQAKLYLDKVKKPTALRSLVEEQKSDDTVGIFASQVLTAKSWYRGSNVDAAEMVFAEMIEAVLNNTEEDINKIINNGAAKVQQTIN